MRGINNLKFMIIKIDKNIAVGGIILAAAIFIVGGLFLAKNNQNPQEIKITVFKDPDCSCCGDYVDYLKTKGFAVEVIVAQDIISLKEKYNIPTNMESCHTSVIGKYFVEGHVPIEAIRKLLTEKPNIDGISLPGMPAGSPGMGGIKTGAFQIYGLKNGQASEFMSL